MSEYSKKLRFLEILKLAYTINTNYTTNIFVAMLIRLANTENLLTSNVIDITSFSKKDWSTSDSKSFYVDIHTK